MKVRIAAHDERTVLAWWNGVSKFIHRESDGRFVVTVGDFEEIRKSPLGGREVAVVDSFEEAKRV